MSDERVITYAAFDAKVDDIRDWIIERLSIKLTDEEHVRLDDGVVHLLRDLFVLEEEQ